MTQLDIKGVIPPVPTPFENGRVACERLAENIRRWCRTGISGLLVLGSNGEYVYLTGEEKRQVVQTAVAAAAPDTLIMAGTGCESTAATIELTRECADLGAHAALVVTPAYYGGKMTAAALIGHFSAVADHSPIPILLYSVPKFTHLNLAPETVAELSAHPNIIGIKDSSGNVNQLGEYLNVVQPEFKVLVGSAGAFLGALSLGCAGGILALANVAPRACVEIQTLVEQGDVARARRLQLDMIPVNRAVTATYGIAGLKAALDMLGYYGGPPREPLLPLGGPDRDALKAILQKAGLLA